MIQVSIWDITSAVRLGIKLLLVKVYGFDSYNPTGLSLTLHNYVQMNSEIWLSVEYWWFSAAFNCVLFSHLLNYSGSGHPTYSSTMRILKDFF